MRGDIHGNMSANLPNGRAFCREQIDVLRRRVELLRGRDRLMMIMYLDNGISFRQMGRLMGLNETSIARRVHKLAHRLLEGQYVTCIKNRDKLTRMEMLVATDCFVRGISQKDVAEKRKCSQYRVRRILRKVRELGSRYDGRGRVRPVEGEVGEKSGSRESAYRRPYRGDVGRSARM